MCCGCAQVAKHAPPGRRASLAGHLLRLLGPCLQKGALSKHPGAAGARARLLRLAIAVALLMVGLQLSDMGRAALRAPL